MKSERIKARAELTPHQSEEIKQAFELFDSEERGKIDVRDLRVVLQALGFEPKGEELAKMIRDIDPENSGIIVYADFVEFMTQIFCGRDANDEIRHAFRLFDDDSSGTITFEKLKKVAIELGEVITDEELQEMIGEADRNGDGEVDEDDFIRIMRKTALF